MASSKMSAGCRRTTTITARHPAWHAICAAARLPTRVARHPAPHRTLRTPTRRRRSADDVPINHRRAGRRHPGRRGRRAVPAPPAARAGAAGARDRQGGRRGRHLVVEPLPGGALRQRGLHLPVPVLRAALQGLELEREVPRPARDRALAALRRRPARPAQDIQFSTTITSAHFDEERGRWTITTDARRRPSTPSSSSAARACSPRPMEHLFEGQDSFRGPILHTSKLARRRHRPGRQARRRRRHRRHRHPGDPDDRRRGRAPDRVRPHPAVRAADEEPALRSGRSRPRTRPGSTELRVDDPAHLHRLRVRLRRTPGPTARPRSGARCWRRSTRTAR